MKKNKLLFSLAVLIFATALSGCHAEIFGEDGTPPSATPTPTPSATPTPIIAPVAKFSISKSDFLDERIETIVENNGGMAGYTSFTEEVAEFNSTINRFIEAAGLKTCEDLFDGDVPGYSVINHLEDLGYILIKGATHQDSFFVFEFSCEADGEIKYFHFGDAGGQNVIKRPNESSFLWRATKTEKHSFFNGTHFALDTEQIIRRGDYDVCFNKTTLIEEPCTTESLNASFKDYFESFDSLRKPKHVLTPIPLYKSRTVSNKFNVSGTDSLELAKRKIYSPGFGNWYSDFYRIYNDGIYTMFDFKNSSTWNSITDCYNRGGETFCFEGDRIKKYSLYHWSIEYHGDFDVETFDVSGTQVISTESTIESISSGYSTTYSVKVTFQENTIKYEQYDFVTPATFRATSTTDTSYVHCFDYNANVITTEEDCN